MQILDGIRATGLQKLRSTAENGETVEITLYFLPAAQQWKMDIVSGNFTLNGSRVFRSPNTLMQYKNIISFGLGCIVSDGGEPFLVNDFSSGRCQLALLSSDEVDQVDDFYTGLRDEG